MSHDCSKIIKNILAVAPFYDTIHFDSKAGLA